jgi:hypothetical protein
MTTYPYIFLDESIHSETYLCYSIMVSDSLSYDGFITKLDALEALKEITL